MAAKYVDIHVDDLKNVHFLFEYLQDLGSRKDIPPMRSLVCQQSMIIMLVVGGVCPDTYA